jgi:hypothetical protein
MLSSASLESMRAFNAPASTGSLVPPLLTAGEKRNLQ